MNNMKDKLTGGTFKHVEGELYHFYETKKELTHLRQEILYNPTVSKGFFYKDPTGEKAVSLVNDRRIQHLERVLDAITSVYESLPPQKKQLVHLLYWERPKQYTWEGIAHQLFISKRQAQRWRKSIVEEIAYRLGWR